MTTIYSTATSLQRLDADGALDEAQLAAAAFLARYIGRPLEATKVVAIGVKGAAAVASKERSRSQLRLIARPVHLQHLK